MDTKGRLIQYYNDLTKGIWTYYIKEHGNPCGCGSNCYHYEYDKSSDKIYGVCNACNIDICVVTDDYKAELLEKGVWNEK